ncbi:MAG: MTH1187 family thiamine-binding protein [Fimbriimonadia bacterium]
MALMEISVVPVGTASPSIGDYVAAAHRVAVQSGLPYVLGEFGTVIEGEPAELLALAARIHAAPFEAGAKRVVTTIKLDQRMDKEVHVGDKAAAVQRRLE